MPDLEPTSWNLSGFGDEIHPNPELQVAVLQALGARFIEVRSAWGVNVVDLDDERLEELGAILTRSGMGVSAIGSPIGKVALDGDPDDEVARLSRIVRVAHALGTPSIRIFSFFLEGQVAEDARDAVLTRMSLLADAAQRAGVVLLHENEKGIYGDTPERVLDLVESVGSPALRVAWDSANFVQVGVARPHDEGYALLRPYLDYLQVKDALSATGEVVPAGQGDGQVAATVQALAADGYTGFASLEPHLADGHELGGFSGPFAFGVAARAFRRIADDAGIVLR
ncbi:sugar phosphate isomerase/epimerase family protein [Microbacterium sp. NPDC019599]|uniref:sugar phosphate isomerase/epimerase family protein n=1 Tax=Microbacterium sp. NPDC019599 TaxID=3154690 RepID=UPI0033E540E3